MLVAIATVVEVTGQAWVLNSDGSLTELHAGSRVPADAHIKTASGASVTLQTEGGMPLAIGDDHDAPSGPELVDNGIADGSSAAHAGGAIAIPVWDEAHSVTQRPLPSSEDQPEPVNEDENDEGGGGLVRLGRIVETTGPDLILKTPPVAREPNDLPKMNRRAMAGSGEHPLSDDAALAAMPVDSLAAEAPNSSPSAMDDHARIDEKSTARGNVLDNDTDLDGDALQVVEVGGEAVPEQGLTVVGSAGGRFTIQRDGSYTFETGKDFHSLAEDEAKPTTIVYTVSDGRHAYSTAVLEITVTGTNDVPIATPSHPGQDAGTVEEDRIAVAEGKLDIVDADHDQSFFREQQNVARPHGTFSIDAEGHWRYELDNDHPEVQALAQGETLTDKIPLLTADGTETFVVITINGTNDVPVIDGAHAGEITEDEALTVAGQLTVSDIDKTDTHTWSIVGSPNGTYGSIQIDAAGLWIYTADPQATQSLAAGEQKTETFTVLVDDGHGGKTEQLVTVTVTGTNDTPIISGEDTGALIEDAAPSVSRQLLVQDVDIRDSHTWSVQGASKDSPATLKGSYGAFAIDQTGKWTYTADDRVQSLAVDEQKTETFTVLVDDGHGGKVEQVVTVTVTGSNDTPIISGKDTGELIEDAVPSVSGQLSVEDVDIGDSHTWSVKGDPKGSYGTLTIDQTGKWTYTVDDRIQSLAVGVQKTETFVVSVDDGHGGKVEQTISLNVTGTNDEPIVGGKDTGAIVEDEAQSVSGQLSVEDVDIGDSHTWSVKGDPKGSYGTLTIDQTGKWTYTVDDRIQALAAGVQKTETFLVLVDDGHGGKVEQTISLNVTGTNDEPIVGGKDTGTIVEDEAQSVSGQLSVDDIDIGDLHTWSVKGDPKGNYGTLTIDQTGKWTYTVDDRIQALAADVRKTETFSVLVNDGNGGEVERTIRLSVTGANDQPVISGEDAVEIIEDTKPSVSGQLSVMDVDIDDSHTWSVKSAPNGKYGTFTIDQAGKWTYMPDIRARSLRDGEKEDEVFTVSVDDGHGGKTEKTVTVTVAGTNDAPIIVSMVEELTEDRNVTDDGFLVAGHKVTIDDTDAGENGFSIAEFKKSTGNGNKPLGDLEFHADGSYNYKLDNDHPVLQGLPGGQSIVETYLVTSKDGTGTGTITIIINGTNDLPTVTDSEREVTEDKDVNEKNQLTASGELTIFDQDADEGQFLAGAKLDYVTGNDSPIGELTVKSDGTYDYTVDNSHPAVQGLRKGENIVQVYKVTSKDGTATSTITITINGVDDKPVITVDTPDGDKGTVTEDVVLEAAGKLKIVDADHDQSSFRVQDGTAGKYGTFTIDASGKWKYALNNDDPAVQSLGVGKTLEEKISVLSADGTETFVMIVINGTNDAPTISGKDVGAITEDEAQSASGQLSVHDIDTGDSHTWSLKGTSEESPAVLKGSYGTLTIDQTGKWIYTVDDRIQSLAADVQKAETFAVLVDDGNGGKAEQIVTLTLTGTNDAPIISGKDTGTIVEDAAPSVSGQLSVEDIDIGDSHTWSVKDDSKSDGSAKGSDTSKGNDTSNFGDTSNGNYGKLTIDQTGKWTYTPDDRIQSLAANEKKTETFTVLVDDGHGGKVEKTVTLTLTGENDAPEISGTSTGSVMEDSEETFTGKLDVSDKDINDRHTWSIDGPANGKYGSLSVNKNGEWTYTVDKQATHVLIKDQKETDTFTVMVDDGHGGIAKQTVTMTIMGTNDVPTIKPHDPGTPPDPRHPGIPGDPGTAGDRGTVIEDFRTQAKGKLDITDRDHGESTFKPKTETDDYGKFSIDTNGEWTYTLNNSDPKVQALSGNDSLPPRTFEVTSADGTATHTVKINVIGTNDAPISADNSAAMPIGGKHTFTTAEFKFQDSHGECDHFDSVIITRIPDRGTLTLAGKSVTTNQPISASDIAAGKLVYTPSSNSKDTSFGFKVRDNGGTANDGRDTSDEYNFQLATGKLILGTNRNEDDSAGNLPGLGGGSGDDIVVGDLGGTVSVAVPGNSYNIVMVLDRSDSMKDRSDGKNSQTRLHLLKDVVTDLVESLGNHVGGTVNLLVISFSDDAKTVVEIPDLKKENVPQALAEIRAIERAAATNYVEPFTMAVRWFEKQQPKDAEGRDYKNVTYFVTDGEPTKLTDFYLAGQAEILKGSIEAFRPLSEVSSVYAIGMGENEGADLQYFDNTPKADGRSGGACGKDVTIFKQSTRPIPDDAGLDLGGRDTVYTTPHELKAGQNFVFNLFSDLVSPTPLRGWELQTKGPGGEWRTVEGQDPRGRGYSGTTGYPHLPPVPHDGEYRVAFSRLPNTPYDGTNDGTKLAEIAVAVGLVGVSGPVCEPQIVKTPRELKSALNVGAFKDGPDSVGGDQIDGGPGNDILFGDSINTDHLHSKNHPAGKHDDYGMQGLRDFLTDDHNRAPTDKDIYDYIRLHHAELNKAGDTRGKDDVIRGKDGDDIIYGQGGNDKLFGDAGNDILIGGTGNDTMEGGSGSDTFVWLRGDGGTANNPAVDTILDFDKRSRSDGGDILDLRDLLPEFARDDLSNFLHFEREGEDTVIEISTTGSVRNPANIDQKIVLQGVDLTSNHTLSDAVILNGLIQQGKLLTALSDANS